MLIESCLLALSEQLFQPLAVNVNILKISSKTQHILCLENILGFLVKSLTFFYQHS